MSVAAKITSLFRRKPLTVDRLRALEEAELAKDQLRSVKTGSSWATSGSQQIDASRPGSR